MTSRLAGILIPFFSLRSKKDLGIGDTASLKEFIDFCSNTGIGFIHLLPINETTSDNNPYSPISSIAINPLSISFEEDLNLDVNIDEINSILKNYNLNEIKSGSINYEKVYEIKEKVLKKSYESFSKTYSKDENPKFKKFNDFCLNEAYWLNDYCIFKYLISINNETQDYTNWKKNNIKSKEDFLNHLKTLNDSSKLEINNKLSYYAYVQWIAFNQWKSISSYAKKKNIKLMSEIHYEINTFSVDVWSNPKDFNLENNNDYDIKFPIYNWKNMEINNYKWIKNKTNFLIKFFEILKINSISNFKYEKINSLNYQNEKNYVYTIINSSNKSDIIVENSSIINNDTNVSIIINPKVTYNDGEILSGFNYNKLSLATYNNHNSKTLKCEWNDTKKILETNDQTHPKWISSKELIKFFTYFSNFYIDDKSIPKYNRSIFESFIKELFLSNSNKVSITITDLFLEENNINFSTSKINSPWSYRIPTLCERLESDESFKDTVIFLRKSLIDTARSIKK